MDGYTFDYMLRVCGGAFFVAVAIGLICLGVYLVGYAARCWGMSWKGILLNGWTPGVQFNTWKIDKYWRTEE